MSRFCVYLVVFCAMCCRFSVLSYPQGAPVRTESCVNLQPVHTDPLSNQPVQNQKGTTKPYRILVSQQQYQTCTTTQQCGLQPLQVSIQGQGGLFKGFIVQARTPSGGSRSWGHFFPLQTGDSKVIQCQNGLTLTHTANNDKNIVRFAWIPEPGMRDQVQFVEWRINGPSRNTSTSQELAKGKPSKSGVKVIKRKYTESQSGGSKIFSHHLYSHSNQTPVSLLIYNVLLSHCNGVVIQKQNTAHGPGCDPELEGSLP
uniref:Uncharacterized protein LOC111115237 n=1 Tax=Crassostrea virginica TaxID=6565 RepID=A0A8B8C1S6_CRAVI|nr:uncharacterized protein LOC111115237 [Crassostrea virginica]